MRWEPVDLPAPRAGEVRVRHTAVGLNYIDTYHRSGLYPVPVPATLGVEAAGVVESVGDGVTDLAPGDRVLFDAIHEGVLRVHAPSTRPLREAAEAHRALEARETTGPTVLLP